MPGFFKNSVIKQENDEVNIADPTVLLQGYVEKIRAHMGAMMKFNGTKAEKEYKQILEQLNSEEFNSLYASMYKNFLYEFGLNSFSHLLNPDQIQRRELIESRFDNLEAFYKKIKQIRAVSNPEEVLQYKERILNALLADPTSPFVPILFVEIALLQENKLIDHALSLKEKTSTEKDAAEEITKGIEAMKIANDQGPKDTKNNKTEKVNADAVKDQTLLLQGYRLFLKLFSAAHMQCMPKMVETNKDKIQGIHHNGFDGGFNNRSVM